MTIRLPFLSVRVVALLMLLAGLSLGVFAARALHAGHPTAAAPVLDAAIETKVALYQQYYALDPRQTDRVRQCLREFDASTVALYRDLRTSHPAPFEVLRKQMDERMGEILKEAGVRHDR
jgi:hypothetical protein